MTQVPLAPPPASNNPIQDRWLYLLWKRVASAGQLVWGYLNFSGSNLTDIETRNHADLQNLNTASYYHLTASQTTDLTDGNDSTLHYHTADRVQVELQYEAGENLTVGDPLKLNTNKLYKATNADTVVLGVAKATTFNTFTATVVVQGRVTLSGLVANTPYFAGAAGLTSTVPVSGYIHRVGVALTAADLLVNVEEPILLA